MIEAGDRIGRLTVESVHAPRKEGEAPVRMVPMRLRRNAPGASERPRTTRHRPLPAPSA